MRTTPDTTIDRSTPTTAATSARRLVAIDAARGLAVLGMIAVHSLMAYDADGDPTWTFSLAAGRASAIFAVLAGVGIAFVSRRKQQKPGIDATAISWSLAARALMIALIGLSLGFTDSDYGVVILGYYAAMFLLAIPLIRLSTRALVFIAVALAICAPLLSQALRPHLPEQIGAQLSFNAALHQPLRFACDVLFTGEFPAVVWMTYVCVGLVVGRLVLTAWQTALGLVATGVALMLTSKMVSWLILYPFGGLDRIRSAEAPDTDGIVDEFLAFGGDGTTPTSTWWWLGVDGPHTGTPFDLMATVGSSLLVIGAMLLLGHVTAPVWSTIIRVVLAPLAAIGSLSLTVYVSHILFVNSAFDVYGPVSGYVRQVVCITALALVWRATAGRGPLEGLVRFVTIRVDRFVRRHHDKPAGRHAA